VRRFAALAVSVLLLCSCTVFQTRRVRDLYVEPGYVESVQQARLVLDSLAVHKGFDARTLEANAAYILRLLIARRNQAAHSQAKTLLLRARIKEEEFSRRLRTLNTVTVELIIFERPNDNTVAMALYSESSPETIESYAYLHSVIRRAFEHLSR
jgi:hypothetical protein